VDLNKVSALLLWKTYFWHSSLSIKYLMLNNNNSYNGYYPAYSDVDKLVDIIWSTENATCYNIFFFIYILYYYYL